MSSIKAVFFDFMGTCLDWCSSVANELPSELSEEERRQFALDWRVDYFRENDRRLRDNLAIENIDETLLRTLQNRLLTSRHKEAFKEDLSPYISAWHRQRAWPDVARCLARLRDDGLEVFVLANGSTRLQLDLIRSSKLSFDLLMSSQLVDSLKPAKEHYLRGLELVGCRPDEAVQVAAHVADLRGAKSAGLRTIYIRRATDDIHEDLTGIEQEFDAVLNDMQGLHGAIRSIINPTAN